MRSTKVNQAKSPRLARRAILTAAAIVLVFLVPAFAAGGRVTSMTHCAGIVSGAATDSRTGSVLAVGIPFMGTASNRSTVMRVGAVPCLGRLELGTIPGDCNNDQVITLEDYQCFEGCLGGPESAVAGACSKYDLDTDGTISHADFALFQRLFGTSIGQ